PGAAVAPAESGAATAIARNNDPWYTSLWHTIADTPHGPPAPPAAPNPAATPGPAPPAPAQPGG
ncbi:MAG TPA: septum formation initiator family protein, partial [Mycobacterium sp.]|nr:septum formation initiator family protein [Mycobacterium sp.]